MIKTDIQIADKEARQTLDRMAGAVAPGRRRPLMRVLGKTVEVELRDHFQKRGREPNKRGWRKSGFWPRIRRVTALTDATDSKATVTIADPAIRQKVYGGTIRASGRISPSTGKPTKYLSIPLKEEVYGDRPCEYGPETFWPYRSRRGNLFLMGEYAQGRVQLYYLLVREVRQEPDPRALPNQRLLGEKLVRQAARFVEKEVRRGQ